MVLMLGAFRRMPQGLERIQQRMHSAGFKGDCSPLNIRTQGFHHLIEPAQAFSRKEGKERIRIFSAASGIDEFAYGPGLQADIVHDLTEIVQDSALGWRLRAESLLKFPHLVGQTTEVR